MGITIRPIYLFSKTPHDGVVHVPIITTEFLSPLLQLDQYDALLLTAKTTVTALNRLTCGWNRFPVLAVGEATAREAASYGAEVLGVAQGYGHELVAMIMEKYPHLRWLYPHPEQVANDLVSPLRQAGVVVGEAVLYRTLCNDTLAPMSLENDAILIFTSPSAVRCFQAQHNFLSSQIVIAIGATTQKAFPHEIDVKLPKMPTVSDAVALANTLAVDR